MKGRQNKLGQTTMSLPFGLIFSIILIIVFIVVAFIVVKSFLSTNKCSQVGSFYSDFEHQVNNVWKGSGADIPFKISLPTGIKKICFANMSALITNQEEMKGIRNYDPESTIFLLPTSESCGMGQKIINHLNLAEITATKNPYCISTDSEIRIKKGVYDSTVMIIIKDE